MSEAPQATERVLPTLNADGTRRWLRPLLSTGRYWRRRRRVAWLLIALFVSLPMLRLGGKPLILLDLPRREFTFVGHPFLATDTALLMVFLLGAFLTIFWLTALLGRVWCGWGCPQTVYLEFVFRPLERWIEGPRATSASGRVKGPRKWLLWLVYSVLAVVLANVFLGYFVRIETLWQWVSSPPTQHPVGFAIVALTSALIFIDFTWFREQMCVVACPYARLQSALLDKRSLTVAYDDHRGEPRGKLRKSAELSVGRQGDCVDCKACVHTCPTGIDIRNGLQMECIACTQCADACDAVMDRLGKPQGLIRYASPQQIEDRQILNWRERFLRVRTVAYPMALVVLAVVFVTLLARQHDAEVTLLRGIGAPFAELGDGRVQNTVRLKIRNRADTTRSFTVRLVDAADLELVMPNPHIELAAGAQRTEGMFVIGKASSIGKLRTITVEVGDGMATPQRLGFELLGPP